jgi:hypothetical protein
MSVIAAAAILWTAIFGSGEPSGDLHQSYAYEGDDDDSDADD